MKLSIVLPCYNEADNIPLILRRFSELITGEDIEVIMVNNGSTDNSKLVLEEELCKYKFAKVVTVDVNQGYGYGILRGLESAKGDFLGWMHADMQTDPKDVLSAYHYIDKHNWDNKLYVKGIRNGRSLIDRFFTLGMGIFESILLQKRLYDINAQPNIFSRKFYETWRNPPTDFSLDLFALYRAKIMALKIYRFNVLLSPRINGISSWNNGLLSRYRLIKRTVAYSIELKRKVKNGIIEKKC